MTAYGRVVAIANIKFSQGMQIIAASYFPFYLLLHLLAICSFYRLRQLMRIKDSMLFDALLFSFCLDGLTTLRAHIIAHNHNRHIRVEDALHLPLCNLLSANKTVLILLLVFSLSCFTFIYSQHTQFISLLLFLPAILMPTTKNKKRKKKSPKTGWHESSFSETSTQKRRSKIYLPFMLKHYVF